MNKSRMIYGSSRIAIPKTERDALAAIYRFALSVYQTNRKAAATGGEENPKLVPQERRPP